MTATGRTSVHKSFLLLPLIAMAAPALGQEECDAVCQEERNYSREQGGSATPLEEDEILVIQHPWRKPIDPKDPLFVRAMNTEIIVTGKLDDAVSERTEAISYPQIQSGSRLENSLRNIPGLQQSRRSDARSANPTSQGVTLRGLGGNASSRALLTLDGIPQADPFGGWVSWPGYDALNLATVIVRRGGGQPSAGPGAIAGVIELESSQRTGDYEARAAYGSRNSLDANASGIFTLGKGHVSLSGSYARGDGFIPIIKSQRGAVDRPAPYEQAGIALRAVAPLNADTELQFSARAFTDERDRGFDFSDNKSSGMDASLRLVDKDGDWRWSALGYVQLREFATRSGGITANRNSVTLVQDQFATPSTGLGARFELRPPMGDKAELRLGADWRRTMGETQENFFFTGLVPGRYRNAGGQTDSVGGFAEFTYQPSDAVTLTAGGRLDQWRISGGFLKEINLVGGSTRSDDRFANRSGSEWTGRAGAAFDLNDDFTLRGSAYTGWRLPTLNELYRPFRVGADATAANAALMPERVKGVEGGFSFYNGDFGFSATAFYNRLDNPIANVIVGQGPGVFPGVGFIAAGGRYNQRQNLDAIISKGLELDARVNVSGAITLRGGYTYVDATVRGGVAAIQLNGLRPAQVARHSGGAGLDYDGQTFQAGLSLRYIGAQFEDDGNRQRLKDALSVDARLGYRISDGLWIEAYGENMLNARIEATVSSSGIVERATPRTLWLGLRWKAR